MLAVAGATAIDVTVTGAAVTVMDVELVTPFIEAVIVALPALTAVTIPV